MLDWDHMFLYVFRNLLDSEMQVDIVSFPGSISLRLQSFSKL